VPGAIVSDRRFRFPVTVEQLWSQLGRVGEYPTWWPWLRSFDGRRLGPGESWRCSVQPPLPYAVRFRLTIDHVEPEREVVAHVDGDVSGTARIRLRALDHGCELHLSSALAPDRGALRAMAALARPLVRFGHDWVLDAGARQFATSLGVGATPVTR